MFKTEEEKANAEKYAQTNFYKFFMQNKAGTAVLGKTKVGKPGEGTTQTFTEIGSFETEQEAINCHKYINTKFCRAMLSILKVTQHNPAATWKFVPMQDFTPKSDINWNASLPSIDWQLYMKYDLDVQEINFIESRIKYRDDLPREWYGSGKYQVVMKCCENEAMENV